MPTAAATLPKRAEMSQRPMSVPGAHDNRRRRCVSSPFYPNGAHLDAKESVGAISADPAPNPDCALQLAVLTWAPCCPGIADRPFLGLVQSR